MTSNSIALRRQLPEVEQVATATGVVEPTAMAVIAAVLPGTAPLMLKPDKTINANPINTNKAIALIVLP
jgi:hypothetical protein